MIIRGRRELVVWAAAATLVSTVLAGSADAQTRAVSGQLGILGEWELSATVTEQTKGDGQWVGQLSLKHIGFCSADGPEEKTGEMRLLISQPSGDLTATMSIDGDVCTFTGKLKAGYDGVMRCPNRRSVPIMLSIR